LVNKEKVGKRCKVYEASKIYGIFVKIKIIDLNDNPNEERPLRNAFDLLISRQQHSIFQSLTQYQEMHWINSPL